MAASREGYDAKIGGIQMSELSRAAEHGRTGKVGRPKKTEGRVGSSHSGDRGDRSEELLERLVSGIENLTFWTQIVAYYQMNSQMPFYRFAEYMKASKEQEEQNDRGR